MEVGSVNGNPVADSVVLDAMNNFFDLFILRYILMVEETNASIFKVSHDSRRYVPRQ